MYCIITVLFRGLYFTDAGYLYGTIWYEQGALLLVRVPLFITVLYEYGVHITVRIHIHMWWNFPFIVSLYVSNLPKVPNTKYRTKHKVPLLFIPDLKRTNFGLSYPCPANIGFKILTV